jgi:hypothetical protein
METEKRDIKKQVSLKNLIRLIALLVMVIFFMPTFLVSCSGQDIELSAARTMTGYNYQGEKVIESHLICVVFILLPIVILGIWFLKGIVTDKIKALITAVGALADIIMWFVFRSEVKETATQSGFSFSTTGWFAANLILLVGLFAVGVGIYFNYLSVNWNMSDGNGLIRKVNHKLDNQPNSQHTVDISGYCGHCGSPIRKGNGYCTQCGSKFEEKQ